MLAPFTNHVGELLHGVNIGGLGTLVASLASTISYFIVQRSFFSEKASLYENVSLYNFSLLIVSGAAFAIVITI